MKLFFSVLLAFQIFSTSAACEAYFKSEDLCVDLIWTDGPYDGMKSSFEITTYKKSEGPQSPQSPSHELDAYVWMVMDNGHSHGGPAFNLQAVGNGQYRADDVRFFMHGMKGHWQVRFELLDQEGKTIEMTKLKVSLQAHSGGHGGGHHH